MSEIKEEEIKEEVLKILLEAPQKEYEPKQIFQALREQDADDLSIRKAIWYLIARDRVELTPGFKLKFKQNGAKPSAE
jgi:hypothetical protein